MKENNKKTEKKKNSKDKLFTFAALVLILIVLLLVSCANKNDKKSAEKNEPTLGVTNPEATNTMAPEIATYSDAVISKDPEATESPQPSEEPDVTDVPTATEEPSTTEKPDVTVTPTKAATKTPAPTKAAIKNTPTPVPTKTAQKNTPTPTPTKVPAKNTPTPTSTQPSCDHMNSEVIYKKVIVPEEGHWETKEAWDEPVYVYCCVCNNCKVTELDFTEDGRTISDNSYNEFMKHTSGGCTGTETGFSSYGSTNVLVDTIHHPAEQVWVVDKLESFYLVADYFICYDCGFTESMDY